MRICVWLLFTGGVYIEKLYYKAEGLVGAYVGTCTSLAVCELCGYP